VASDGLEDGADHREMAILLGLEQDTDGTRGHDPQLAGRLSTGPIIDHQQSADFQGRSDRLLLSR
jgi:hypothetical protein